MEQAARQFEQAWSRFETTFKGKLLAQSKTQKLTLSLANLALKGASADWFSGYGAEGRWLSDYTKECPDRAEAITAILKHELRLRDEAEQGRQQQEASSKAESAPPPEGLASVLSPLVEALKAMLDLLLKGSAKPASPKNKQGAIDAYVAQLQAHKKVILDLIRKPD